MSVSGTLQRTVKGVFYSVLHKNVLFVLEVKKIDLETFIWRWLEMPQMYEIFWQETSPSSSS